MAIVKGTDALKPVEKDNNEDNTEDRILRYIKADEEIKVRLLGDQEFARVNAYDIYPLTGTIGIPEVKDHFEEGKKILFKEADRLKKELGVDKKRKEMNDIQFKAAKKSELKPWVDALTEAYRLEKGVKFLFAFIDAESGKPFLMQASENAAPVIQKTIAESQEQKDIMLFKLTKSKGGFTVAPDMTSFGKLTPEQAAIIEDTKDFEAPIELFGEAHIKPTEKYQLEVLKKMNETEGQSKGLFTEYLAANTISGDTTSTTDNSTADREPLDIQDEDLPF